MFALLALLNSCGELTTTTNRPAPSSSPAAPQSYAVVLGANFTDPIGSLSLISLDTPHDASTDLVSTHSDAVVRSFGGLLYVVNRLGADNIQVVDPSDFSVRSQVSTGVGTNPQEIVALSQSDAYVTLYQPEDNRTEGLDASDLVRINPQDGTILASIDLTRYAVDDGDRYARASAMLQVGEDLFVAVQDLPGNLALPPDAAGKIVRLNIETGRVEAVAVLQGRNPFAISYSSVTELLYIGCPDFFDLDSPYGGIEVLNPTTMRTVGFLPDEMLGGWLGDIEVVGNFGFVVVGTADFSENRVVRFSLESPEGPYEPLYASPAYLQEIAVAPDGLLLIGDRDPAVNGVVFLDPESGEQVGSPVSVGFPPASITFVTR